MSQLLRFPSSVKRDPAIEVWMHEHLDELGAIAQRWFEVMRDCGDDVRELLHDGHPTACVGDAALAPSALRRDQRALEGRRETGRMTCSPMMAKMSPAPPPFFSSSGCFSWQRPITFDIAMMDSGHTTLLKACCSNTW
jgi:hypothetical protein